MLDGVDKVAHVHALAKDISWFGPGSRIIITTRDRELLNSCGVETVHQVKCLDEKDALQMFKQIAFGGGTPPDGFEKISIRATRLAHGLPYALQAYALFLRGSANTPKEWEEALGALESSLDQNIGFDCFFAFVFGFAFTSKKNLCRLNIPLALGFCVYALQNFLTKK
ncbi:P-loop containing nucleoside triphosphate hydrolase [Arabidopsis thaliana x Arabidopsis arenosa]|uniref:P-loop containing nucleoside triphosphate hydrolase n=1 Tax=Arabidopsis thaliana x Arabidopsis arenosa TaxID=1240361 RepID=A0A8T2BLU5_9BRAS|nr:P-loop containing nucleoside triphosphate hydrolase [Arabidopsis thaliana x Arabidopsis arenosa]